MMYLGNASMYIFSLIIIFDKKKTNKIQTKSKMIFCRREQIHTYVVCTSINHFSMNSSSN